jgi:hypothetical protein
MPGVNLGHAAGVWRGVRPERGCRFVLVGLLLVIEAMGLKDGGRDLC